MEKTRFVVVDVETTGLSSWRHKLTEVAMVKAEKGEVIDNYSTLINPQTPIPPFITRLTGISDRMVKRAPKVDEVMPEIKKFIGKDAVFVAHNARFDYSFIDYNLRKCGYEGLMNDSLCTAKMARRVFYGLPSYRLSELCNHLDIKSKKWHRAEADLLATHELLNRIFNECKKNNITEIRDILKLQYKPIRKARERFRED